MMVENFNCFNCYCMFDIWFPQWILKSLRAGTVSFFFPTIESPVPSIIPGT